MSTNDVPCRPPGSPERTPDRGSRARDELSLCPVCSRGHEACDCVIEIVDQQPAGSTGINTSAPWKGTAMATATKAPEAPLSVKPAWWGTVATRAERLKNHTSRVHALIESQDPSSLPGRTVEALLGLLTEFADAAEELAAELAEIRDGTSEHLVAAVEPVDLEELARQFQAGMVFDGELLVEKVVAYGDGPDALPEAVIALGKRLRGVKPEERDKARLVLLLREDADPAPAAG